jgi:hypothetical protein
MEMIPAPGVPVLNPRVWSRQQGVAKMKGMSVIFAAALLAGTMVPKSAHAQATFLVISTVNDLYRNCKSNDALALASCLGYIQGVAGGIQTDRSITKLPPPFCMSDQVTLQQSKDAVIAFIDKDPSIKNNSAAGAVEFALVHAYPCGKSPK